MTAPEKEPSGMPVEPECITDMRNFVADMEGVALNPTLESIRDRLAAYDALRAHTLALSEELAGKKARAEKMHAALLLVRKIGEEGALHLGGYRLSGIGSRCIPCIASLAIDQGFDKATADDFTQAALSQSAQRGD